LDKGEIKVGKRREIPAGPQSLFSLVKQMDRTVQMDAKQHLDGTTGSSRGVRSFLLCPYHYSDIILRTEKQENIMPLIKPISDLRNKANEISELAHSSGEPVFITKNGEGDLVVMSMALYGKLQLKL
jgi:prevent-host-death family protein